MVHDNAAARALIGRALRDWAARPTEVASLAEAAAASAAAAYDAVVIDDWLLNEADGSWKVLRSRQSAGLRTVRLLSFVSLASDTPSPRSYSTRNSRNPCASATCIEH